MLKFKSERKEKYTTYSTKTNIHRQHLDIELAYLSTDIKPKYGRRTCCWLSQGLILSQIQYLW